MRREREHVMIKKEKRTCNDREETIDANECLRGGTWERKKESG
jgi:hypothetical protein